jgi:hypothetical protein
MKNIDFSIFGIKNQRDTCIYIGRTMIYLCHKISGIKCKVYKLI